MSAISMDLGSDETTSYQKSGQGAFDLIVRRGGKVFARRGDGELREFANPRDAYDWYRAAHDVAQDHASWNICYHLEDHLPASGN
jgi:hypothetical protein